MLRRTLCLLALATCTVGCGSLPNWTEEPAPAVAAYEPTYYENRVVYFSDAGSPYYYDGPTVVWIQPTWPGYAGYVRHYHHYGPSYHAWHRGHVHPGNPYAGHHRGGVHVRRGPRR